MTLTMIADVLTIPIVMHADMLPFTLKNCYFAPGNSPGQKVLIRALKTNKKISSARDCRQMPATRALLRFQPFPSARNSLRIPDTLIAGIHFHNVIDNR
jgi:hypothetical protein